ncbi:MAG: TetR family transcriptional regulator [Candidatus Cloacimonetes bacterium]|nr:TetR family transcriptional regulator [Candidatus Cloacimonadota bacterium]
MARPKKDKQISKELLLSAALDEFCEKGFHKTKLEDIAKRANVSRGAIYWHFKDKSDFYVSLIKTSSEIVESKFLDIIQNSSSAGDGLRLGLTEYFRFLKEDENFLKVKKLESRKFETSFDLPELEIHFKERVIYWQNALGEIIQKGIDNHEFRKDIDVEAVALQFICTVIGIEDFYFTNLGKINLLEHGGFFVDSILKNIGETKEDK